MRKTIPPLLFIGEEWFSSPIGVWVTLSPQFSHLTLLLMASLGNVVFLTCDTYFVKKWGKKVKKNVKWQYVEVSFFIKWLNVVPCLTTMGKQATVKCTSCCNLFHILAPQSEHLETHKGPPTLLSLRLLNIIGWAKSLQKILSARAFYQFLFWSFTIQSDLQ